MTAVTVCVIVAAICAVGTIAMLRTLHRWDRDDADERARLIIDDADRIVREYERRLNHPSNRGEQ